MWCDVWAGSDGRMRAGVGANAARICAIHSRLRVRRLAVSFTFETAPGRRNGPRTSRSPDGEARRARAVGVAEQPGAERLLPEMRPEGLFR
jgi:hypothetical protein